MQTVTLSPNNVATTHNQENSIQTRWQPYKFNSVTDSFHAEGNRIKGVVMAVKEIFTNFAKFIGNLGISLGNKVCTILNLHPKSTPVVDQTEKTSAVEDDNDVDFLDFEDDDYYLLLETELPEMEKAQGWTNKQKAAAAVATIGAAGVALKTLAYFGGKDSYAEMPWNYTFGWAGDVLNSNVVQPGISGLSSFGNSVYDTVCVREKTNEAQQFCSESDLPCQTDRNCAQPVMPDQTDLCENFIPKTDEHEEVLGQCSISQQECRANADCDQPELPAQTDFCKKTVVFVTDNGDRCVDAGAALKDLFCTGTFGYGYGCPTA